MSFLLDPPSLFIIGIILYFIGKEMGMERLAKIVIGLLIVLSFILFSLLLYIDVFRCIFPIICNNLSGSEYMFHSNITGIYKKDVPLIIVILLFALYPVWIYLGYTSALMYMKRKKRKKSSKEIKSSKDVKSAKESYLFNWNGVPGNDKIKLIDFLIQNYSTDCPNQNYNIDWLKIAIIEKSDDDKTIRIFTENNTLSLRLNDKKTEATKAILTIDDGRTDEFAVKNENGELNIYKESKYAVVRYPDCNNKIMNQKEAVKCAIEKLGGMKSFVKSGNKVLIKVNICGGVPEIPATYTSKEVTGAVLELVQDAGGECIICDADMVWTNFWTNAKAEGWIEWAEKEGVEIDNPAYMKKTKVKSMNPTEKKKAKLVNLSDTDIVDFYFGENSVFGRDGKDRISKEIVEADVIISIPVMKTHLMTGVTLGMKNMYGTLPEIDKARYHKIGINEVICCVNDAFTPNLTIIDGSIGGETIGPLSCEPVNFNTIVASNDVVTADSIAAQLMGFKYPIDIEHIKLAHVMEIGDASQEFKKGSLPYELPSDFKWNLPDVGVGNFYTKITYQLLAIPTLDVHFNMLSDFFLYDASRVPILKYINHAVLQILNDVSKWRLVKKRNNPGKEKKEDHPEKKIWKDINLMLFSITSLLAIFGFVSGGYLAKSSMEFILGLVFAIIVAALFAIMMKTKHLVTILLASSLTAFFVERFCVIAGMWHYIDGAAPPIFSLFSVPIFVIVIIGFSYILKEVYAYVNLSGMRYRNVPVVLTILALVILLKLEGYFTVITIQVITIYAGFAILSLFYNNRQRLEWNFAFATVALAMGGMMELIGASSGLWGYAFGEGMPVFVIFTWAMNAWAACGIAEIFGVNMRNALS